MNRNRPAQNFLKVIHKRGTLFVLLIVASGFPAILPAQTLTTSLATGISPTAVAVNPVTNKVFIVNSGSNNLTEVNAPGNILGTFPMGQHPVALAVNPVTNKIYVANDSSNNITVVDGTFGGTVAISVGAQPVAVAVNSVTNKIYVANQGSNNVTVIDGLSNQTSTIAAGLNPCAIAVNPVTNQVYAVNRGSNNLTVIDGGAGIIVTTLPVGMQPNAVAINAVTNKVFVANEGSNTVTVVDGATNTTATVSAGTNTYSVVVNSITNKIYAANPGSSTVTVIDGSTLNTATVAIPKAPISLALNATTNQVYVGNSLSSQISIIDGATNYTTTLQADSIPQALAINPVTNKLYVALVDINRVDIFDCRVNALSTIQAGRAPFAEDVNPVTNKIYVANVSDNTVTEIDGATGTTATIGVGVDPNSVAVNSVTNKIYTANSASNSVTEIDGPTHQTTNIPVGSYPVVVAVNPVTNKIYVSNETDGTVTEIDGLTHSSRVVPVGLNPYSIAVNPVTNTIYVANWSSGTVSVINGKPGYDTSTVVVEKYPNSIAINPVTNEIYVACRGGNMVEIDGRSNSTQLIAGTGQDEFAVAVNSLTNQIYATNVDNVGTISVVNGYDMADVATVVVGNSPRAIVVDQTTNKIYVAVQSSSGVANGVLATIDGVSNSVSTTNLGTLPYSIAVNPITGQVYVPDYGTGIVAVIGQPPLRSNTLTTNIVPLTNNQTTNSTPTLTLNASSTTIAPPTAMFYQLDTKQNSWKMATGSNPTYTATALALQPGLHYLYAFAADGQESTSVEPNSPMIGDIQAYPFLVTPASTASSSAPSVGYVAFWGINNFGITISWSTDIPSSTVIAYGTTQSLGKFSAVQSALTNSHGVVLTGLSPGTTYYFQAQSTDINGNTGSSTLYSFTTTGVPVGIPPAISSVMAGNLTSNSATISWTTDQPSNSQVIYGATTQYGSQVQDATLVISHSITLTGLIAGTTYNFMVSSANTYGTSASSTNFTFTTSSPVTPAPLISSVAVSSVNGSSATITWITDQQSNSLVDYGTTTSYTLSATNASYVTSHSITLSGLTPGVTYNFSVVSANSGGISSISPNATFSTPAASSGTAPYVGYIAFWGITNSGVTISWSTDMPANTQLAYGTTPSLGQITPIQPALTNSHGVVLTGLNSGTTYYFVAQSTASSGPTGVSSTYSFTTGGTPAAASPVISAVNSTSITQSSATITWTTDQPSSSQVTFRASNNNSPSSVLDPTLVTTHSISVINLAAGTSYMFSVVSVNSSGVSTSSASYTFTTLPSSPLAPVISSVTPISVGSSTATLTWTTDLPASSQVSYGTTTAYGFSSVLNSSLVTSHSVTVTGLAPSTTYDFGVVSANAAGQSTSSPNYTFTTSASSAAAPFVSYIAFWGITGSGVTISWSTNVPANTAVAYGTTAALGQITPIQTSLTSSHGVTLTGLSPSTTYYFVAQSTDQNGNIGYSTSYSFTTIAGPPVVSGLSIAPSTNNTAVIGWTTSVSAYSYVQYGAAAGSYNRHTSQTGLTTNVQCSLTYVPSGVTHYQLVSTDGSGNQVTTPDATFVEP